MLQLTVSTRPAGGPLRFAVTLGAALLTFVAALAQLPAFPGAEGFGAATLGGRGGRVIAVTNLDDSGEGSLRAALEASGPRIVVFRVSGTIALASTIKVEDPYLTVAGQTAPGGGICLRSPGTTALAIKTHDVVLRYLRIRPGPGGESDGLAIQTGEAHDIVVDHCSITWGVDESASMYSGDVDQKIERVTFQYNLIADALDCSTHGEGCHSKGLLLQYCDGVTLHHNLFANNGGRNPMLLSGRTDAVNNVIYNWGGSAVKIENRHGDVFLNYVGNYIAPGADSDMTENGLQVKTEGIYLWLDGNLAEHVRPDESYPEDAVVNYRAAAEALAAARFDYPAVTTTSAAEAYEAVLAEAGATLPARDRADANTVAGVRDRTGRIIDHPDDVGGYPTLATATPPADGDGDGMPDAWETARGLDPADAADGPADRDGDGYTNVEEYINGLVGDAPATPDCHGTPGGVAYRDHCGTCVGGNTGAEPCVPATGVTVGGCPADALAVGAGVELSAAVAQADATETDVTWASSDATVAAVDAAGRVTAIAEGTAEITATTADGAHADACAIAVSTPPGGDGGDGGSGSDDAEPVWYEAEDAALSGGVEVTDVHAGYRGSGFVDFPGDGGVVEFAGVDGGAGGTAELTLRWALGNTDRGGSLEVNGVTAALTTETTGDWATWATKTVAVELVAGTANVIRVRSTGSDLGNLDAIAVTAAAGGGDGGAGGGGDAPSPTTDLPQASTLQAEDAALSGGVDVTDQHAGYRGSGFVNFPRRDGVVEFAGIDGGVAGGDVELRIRYALGNKARTGRLTVNGVARDVTFGRTDGWSDWDELVLLVALLPGGANVIRLESTGADLANVDQISLAPTASLRFGGGLSGGIQLYPNPNAGAFTIVLPLGGGIVRIVDARGQVVAERELGSGAQPVDVSDLPDGVYLATFRSAGGLTGVRFVKR